MSLPFTIFGSTSFDLSPFLIGAALAAFPFDLVFFVAMLSSVVSVPERCGSHRSGAIRHRDCTWPIGTTAAPNTCNAPSPLPSDRAVGALRHGSSGAAQCWQPTPRHVLQISH